MKSNNRLGVIAAVPFWSNSDNLNLDSNYVYMRQVLPELSRQAPDDHFLLFFPDPNYGRDKWVYRPDGLASDKVHFISWPYDTSMSGGVNGFDSVRHKVIEATFGVNIYWLNMVEMGPMLFGGYSHTYSLDSTPCLVAQHHYIIHPSLPYPFKSMFGRHWLQMGGSLASDRVIYNSQHCKTMADEAFGMALNSKKMAELEQKSQVLKFGLLTGQEPHAPRATKKTLPILLYNHRFENYKQPLVTWAAFAELRARRKKFQVWVTQTVGQDVAKHPFDKSLFAPEREDYLRQIAVPAINTLNSTHETFCIAILDSLAVGHLVVLPNRVTFPELVPSDYPFLFNSDKEQIEMLAHILDTWPLEYNRWSSVLSEYAQSQFNLSHYVRDYLAIFHEGEALHRQAKKKEKTLNSMVRFWAGLKKGVPYPLWGQGGLQGVITRYFGLGPQSFPTLRIVREAAQRDDIELVWDETLKVVRR